MQEIRRSYNERILESITRFLDAFIQRRAIALTLQMYLAAPLVALLAPATPYKNAIIASLVLAGFAVPATWVTEAVRSRKIRDNYWRKKTKALYFLWVPLMSCVAYRVGGFVAQKWYGAQLTPTYWYTSAVYAPFSFILQWTLASRTKGQPENVREREISRSERLTLHLITRTLGGVLALVQYQLVRALVVRIQRLMQHPTTQALVARTQRFMRHPVVQALSVILALAVLMITIWYGIVLYLPVLLHHRKALSPSAETLVLTSLNSSVIMLITGMNWRRNALPEHREYMKGARARQEIWVARVALIFGIAGATVSGALVAGIIYGVSFFASQWLIALHIILAFAVYAKEIVSNTLWLLVPVINSRRQVSLEERRAALTGFIDQVLDSAA